MAKDERLYARFDIAMDEHPKVMLLSDAAFRTLMEVTFFSRRQLTDGFLADGVVRRRWPAEAIAELSANDPERPSLYPFVKGGVSGLMIHDYEKHQTTTADIEAKREAGRKGGLAKAKQTSSTSLAPATEVLGQKASKPLADPLAERKQTSTAPLAITETETETETETTTSNEVVKERPAKRGSRLSPDWMPSAASVAKAKEDAPEVDHRGEHSTFVDYWIAQPGQKGVKTDWEATWRNWMRRKQGDLKSRPNAKSPIAKADQNAALFHELYGGNDNERTGSLPALDAGFGA